MSKRRPIVTIFLSDGTWMAKHKNPDIKLAQYKGYSIRELFETDTLPTAFTDDMSIVEVLSALEAADNSFNYKWDPMASGAVTWRAE